MSDADSLSENPDLADLSDFDSDSDREELRKYAEYSAKRVSFWKEKRTGEEEIIRDHYQKRLFALRKKLAGPAPETAASSSIDALDTLITSFKKLALSAP